MNLKPSFLNPPESVQVSSWTSPSGSSILSFTTVDEWDSTINAINGKNDSLLQIWENYFSGYTSQREAADTNVKNEDDLLAALLNNDGIVVIANKAYKPDFVNNWIYVCDSICSSNLTDLNNKTLISQVVRYPSHYEVLHMDIEGWDDSLAIEGVVQLNNDDGFKRRRCTEKGRDNDKTEKDAPQYCSGQNRLDAKAIYQKAGIYFSLLMECKHQRKTGTGPWQKQQTDIYSKFKFRYKPKCGSIVSAQSTNWPNYAFENLEKHNYRPYHSSRSLTRYELDAAYFVQNTCGSPGSVVEPELDIINAGW